MKRIQSLVAVTLITIACLLSISACGSRTPGTLRVVGSQELAQLLHLVTNRDFTVDTSVSGPQGINEVLNGNADIALSDIFPSEEGISTGALLDTGVAVVPYEMVVSSDVAQQITSLSADQIRQIYSGQVTNWEDVGGRNEAITLVTRPANSGIQIAFAKFVLGDPQATIQGDIQQVDTNQDLIAKVQGTQGAIGYAIAQVDGSGSAFSISGNPSNVTPLALEGQPATPAGIQSGSYSFWGIIHFIAKANHLPSATNQGTVTANANFTLVQNLTKQVCINAPENRLISGSASSVPNAANQIPPSVVVIPPFAFPTATAGGFMEHINLRGLPFLTPSPSYLWCR